MWRQGAGKWDFEVLLGWWKAILFLYSWELKTISSSSLILGPPKVMGWKYLTGTCGVTSSYLRVLGAPPHCPRPGPSRPGWLQLGEEGGGRAASPHSGASEGRRGAEGGRAAAWPARKENLLPTEAARILACLRGAPSPRVRPAQAWATGRGRGTLTLLRDSSRNGHSLGRRLFPPFGHDPIQKCPMQVPGRTGIFQSPKLLSTYVSDQTSQQTKCQETCSLLSPNSGR